MNHDGQAVSSECRRFFAKLMPRLDTARTLERRPAVSEMMCSYPNGLVAPRLSYGKSRVEHTVKTRSPRRMR